MSKPPSDGGTSDSNIRLAKLAPDKDTRELFARLMKDAERGEITGAIVVALCRRRAGTRQHYFMLLSGRASSNVTYAAGAVDACSMILRELALREAGIR
jgi:hypothetical protein